MDFGGLLENNLLTVITFLPLVAMLTLALVEGAMTLFLSDSARFPDGVWKLTALGVAVFDLLLGLRLWNRFDATLGTMQLIEHVGWIPEFGINYYMGIDGMSLLLVILTLFLLPIILLASWTDIGTRVKQYIFFMMALQTGMLGAFLSLNMFLFYVFWEVMLIPMYFIIGIWGGPRRIYATVKFFIYTMVGSLLMLVGILVLAYLHAQQFGALNFDYYGFGEAAGILDTSIASDGGPWWQRQGILFGAFALAFAIKVPMFPFHTWLPDAHVEAPTPGSAVLAGVLLKLGTYGMVRYAMPLFPEATITYAPIVVALAVIGIVYGALVAMVQSDVKKLVAYSSVSHMGFIVLGIFALNPQGLEGAVLQMVNHGISTGALFILVGMIYERRHVREISQFGGLAHVMPTYAAFFVIATMSSIGLPALNGFVGEFLILVGAFSTLTSAAVIATTGVILGAVYMLWMVRRVFFGPLVVKANQKLLDLNGREKVVALALTVPMVWIGIYPSTFLTPLDPTVTELLDTMERRGADLANYGKFEPGLELAATADHGGEHGAEGEPEDGKDVPERAAEETH